MDSILYANTGSILNLIASYLALIKNYILHYHLTSPGWIIIFSVIRPFLLVPISALAIIIVFTHRPLESVFLINIAAAVSTVTVYSSSKLFSSRLENRWAQNKLLQKIQDYDFETFFLARLSMLFHFDLLSAVAGVTKIPLLTFFTATFWGFFPESIIYGTLSLSVRNTKFFYVLIPVLLLYYTVILLVRKRLNQ